MLLLHLRLVRPPVDEQRRAQVRGRAAENAVAETAVKHRESAAARIYHGAPLRIIGARAHFGVVESLVHHHCRPWCTD